MLMYLQNFIHTFNTLIRCSSLLAFPTMFKACSSYIRMERRKGRMAKRSVRLLNVQKNLQGLGALTNLKKRIFMIVIRLTVLPLVYNVCTAY